MYLGHLGIGLGARRLSRSLPLWILLVAPILPDVADALTGFTPWSGWMPEFSHSLLGIASLSILMSLLAWFISRNGFDVLLAATLVVSHLPADYVTSRIRPWNGGPAIGLGLYRHPVADFIVESVIIIAGMYFYRQSLEEIERRPGILAAMVVSLIGFQLVVEILVWS